MRKITIIHPSRQRPELAKKVADMFLSNATTCPFYILSIDTSDHKLEEYKRLFEHHTVEINDNKTAIEAINVVANKYKFDIVFVLSDDFICNNDWDGAILRFVKDKTDWILKTNDGCQRWIITLPIMDYEYYNRFRYIYYPGYNHLFCDTEMTHVADLLDKRLIAEHIKIPHIWHKATGNDEVNKKTDSTWAQGEEMYIKRYLKNFDLPLQLTKGKVIKDNSHIMWISKIIQSGKYKNL